MGKIGMFITTIFAIMVMIIRALKSKKTFRSIRYIIKDINRQYLELFKERSLLGRVLQTSLLVAAQIFMSITIITSIVKYVDTYLTGTLDVIVKTGIIIIALTIIYISVGYILLMSSKVYKVLYKVEDKSIKTDLILSYFILSTYFTVLLVFPKQFEESYIIGIIGAIICYGLNLRVLIKVIKNPQHIKSKDEEQVSSASMAVVSALIVVMIILNLFLAVCCINNIAPGAYSGNESNFDLFYYTIITFTTVGYGDISPVSNLAKIMSIIISATSVICITIFLSSVLSYKDKEE